MTPEPLRLSFNVDCPPEQAFSLWAERTSLWWPKGHSVTADPGLDIVFEPRPGGRIFERTPAGREEDWGQVVEWEPPRRLVYTWHLHQDRGDATEVEITFRPDAEAGAGTRVDIEHRGWERLGDRADDRRARNEKGWGGLVPHFVSAANESRGGSA